MSNTDITQGVLKYLVAAGNAKGTNAKLSALMEANRDPDVADHLFAFARLVKDPTFNFYMTAKNIPEPRQYEGVSPYAPNFIGLLQLLTSLSMRKYTGKSAEALVADWLSRADASNRWLFKMAIERSLPGNVGRTLINKVRPRCIYKQPYGGCKSWDPDMVHKRFDWKGDGVIWQTKEDGMTLLIDIKGKTVRTRAGQDVTLQMADYIKPLFHTFPVQWVGHFEAKLLNDEWEPMPRPEANGHFNALFKTGRPIDPEKLELVLLDLIPVDEFYGDVKATTPVVSRLDMMNDAVCTYHTAKNDLVRGWPVVSVVEWQHIDSLEKARELTQQEISFGGEGAVLKRPDGVWKSGKMTSQMKMKNEFECTLVVVGYKPHSKQAGWVGSLLCESLDGILRTYVGSGLNEEHGHELDRTQGYAAFDGKLVEIKAEKISKHNALDLPRIQHIRIDKDQADTYQEVQDAYMDSIAAK